MTAQSVLQVCLELPAHVEVDGSAAALRELAALVRTATDTARSRQVSSSGKDEVRSMSVRTSDGLVQIRYSSGVLSIVGAPDKPRGSC